MSRGKVNYVGRHARHTGRVFGAAVNNKRKRYCQDLATGVVNGKSGKPIADRETGEVIELTAKQKSFRAGYVQGVEESTAAAKTSAGIDTRTNGQHFKMTSKASMPAFKDAHSKAFVK